jgi:cytochrome c-type biogenesis protein CcmH/NrfF
MRSHVVYFFKLFAWISVCWIGVGLVVGILYGFSIYLQPDLRPLFIVMLWVVPVLALINTITHAFGIDRDRSDRVSTDGGE